MSENNLINSKKIAIVGTSGSGKTTLAKELSEKLNISHIELDSIFWLENWQQRDKDEFASIVNNKINTNEWVIDGNYSKVREDIWKEANLIIWLDYKFQIVIFRSVKRTILRVITKEKLWSGNVESFKKSFFTKDSIIVWVLKTYKRRKEEYNNFFKDEIYNKKLLKVNSPKELKKIISTIK